MSDRIYTLDEFYSEKPKGYLYVRYEDGLVRKIFQCHGCQTCFEYIDGGTDNAHDDRVEQRFPHIYSAEVVEGL